eukprot:4747770-Pyramimonas_sp.AAC.1
MGQSVPWFFRGGVSALFQVRGGDARRACVARKCAPSTWASGAPRGTGPVGAHHDASGGVAFPARVEI